MATGNGTAKTTASGFPSTSKRADRILFGKYASQKITLDGEEYLIMKEDDVLGVIEGETKKKLVVTGKIKKK